MFLIFIFAIPVESSYQFVKDYSPSPPRQYENCPNFKFGDISPRNARKFIAVAKYGNSSSVTFWETNWLRFDMSVLSNVSEQGIRFFKIFKTPDGKDNLIYTLDPKCDNQDVSTRCDGLVVVLYKGGLLQAPCNEWKETPSVTFSVDVKLDETIRNYTDLLKEMLKKYTTQYNLKVEDFTPLNHNYGKGESSLEIEYYRRDDTDQKTELKVFLYICGGVLGIIALNCCVFGFKLMLKK